jgi:putative membrane protein
MVDFLAALLAFAAHLVLALVLAVVFLIAYVRSTPYQEHELIRKGNAAAALALMGALVGFAIVLSRAIMVSHGIGETLVWGLIGLIVQAAGHWALSRFLPRLYAAIEEGELAAGIMKAGVAISLGLLNAASMTP